MLPLLVLLLAAPVLADGAPSFYPFKAGDKGWGYLGADGKPVIPPAWQKAMPFSEGLAAVKRRVRAGVPVFGVCLGLQGIVEAFGGELGLLDYPMHGKPSTVRNRGLGVFAGLPEEFQVGRYHSLFARRETFPACLEVTAETEDGVIMGVRHRDLPIEADLTLR